MKQRYLRRLVQALGIVLLLYLLFVLISFIVQPLFAKRTPGQGLTGPSAQPDTEQVLCIDDNNDALLWRLKAIESARHEITLSTFQLGTAHSGMDIMAALQAAAQRGVQVKLIIDGGLNSLGLPGNDLFQALANTENVEIRFYNPISPLKPWKANYRLHDKYLIVDDALYLLGGRNTSDLFLGDYIENQNIDRDLLVYTSHPQADTSIDQVKAYFARVWNEPDNKIIQPKHRRDIPAAAQALQDRYVVLHDEYPQVFAPVDWTAETQPVRQVQLLNNPTAPTFKQAQLWETLQDILADGTEITIQTPYIVCDKAMYQQMTQLAQKRSLRILTNAVENGANPWGCSDYLSHKDNILRTGAEVYEFCGGDSLHAKTILVDDTVSLVGSYNLDMRSTNLNTELMLYVESPALNAELRGKMETAMAASRHIFPDGTQVEGSQFSPPDFGPAKKLLYRVLQVVTRPVRHLL